MELNEVGYILLGWLLGILSPAIISYISNHYKKIALEKIIVSELKDLKNRLIWVPYKVYPKYGMLDEEKFNWVKEQQAENFLKIDNNQNLENNIREDFMKSIQSPEKLKGILYHLNTTSKKDGDGISLKKMLAGIIDSNLMNFNLLDEKFLESILDIKFQLSVYNDEIQRAYDYLKMTFDGNISQTNHQIISSEIKNSNLFIAKRAVLIVEKINLVIK